MKTALVIGGTRFIGLQLVNRLLAAGTRVTLLTRGRTGDPFEDRVERLRADRSVSSAFRDAIGLHTWDVCFDQVGFSGDDLRATSGALAGRIGRYILTSSGVVYGFGSDDAKSEGAFDPLTTQRRDGDARALGYDEGKRQAERAMFEAMSGDAIAVRLPMILGAGDPTRKLAALEAHARDGTAVCVHSAEYLTNYLTVDEAARFLQWVATTTLQGPINACTDEPTSLRSFASIVDAVIGTVTTFVEADAGAKLTPLALPGSLVMDNYRARASGFTFTPLSVSLRALLSAAH